MMTDFNAGYNEEEAFQAAINRSKAVQSAYVGMSEDEAIQAALELSMRGVNKVETAVNRYIQGKGFHGDFARAFRDLTARVLQENGAFETGEISEDFLADIAEQTRRVMTDREKYLDCGIVVRDGVNTYTNKCGFLVLATALKSCEQFAQTSVNDIALLLINCSSRDYKNTERINPAHFPEIIDMLASLEVPVNLEILQPLTGETVFPAVTGGRTVTIALICGHYYLCDPSGCKITEFIGV